MWYIICVLVGMIIGIFLWEKWGVGTLYKGNFRFKQKGKGNTQESQINLETGKEQAKPGRKERITQRKLDKQAKKN